MVTKIELPESKGFDFLFNVPFRSQMNAINTRGNKVTWKRNVFVGHKGAK